MKRTDMDEVQYVGRKYQELSQESLKRVHALVDDDDVATIQKMCDKAILTVELLECFGYAGIMIQAQIASTILQKFPNDPMIKEAMEVFEVESAYGGAICVIKQWAALQSLEYKAAFQVFEKDKTYDDTEIRGPCHYTARLKSILYYSLPKIWTAENNLDAIQNMWPQDQFEVMQSLEEDEIKLANTAIRACYEKKHPEFTTQPAKFMVCFIDAIVIEAIVTTDVKQTMLADIERRAKKALNEVGLSQ